MHSIETMSPYNPPRTFAGGPVYISQQTELIEIAGLIVRIYPLCLYCTYTTHAAHYLLPDWFLCEAIRMWRHYSLPDSST